MSNASARRMQSLLHAPITTLLWRRIALIPFTRKITKIQHFNGGTWMPLTSGDHLRNEGLKRRHEQAEVGMQFDCCIDNLNRWGAK